MAPNELDSWSSCRDCLPALADSGKKTAKHVESLTKACIDGNFDAARQAVERLRNEVGNLLAFAIETSSAFPTLATADQFTLEIESIARSRQELFPVVRTDNRILIGTTVVRVYQTSQGSMSATIGSQVLHTSSAVAVIEEVARQSKEKFDHKKALKSLKAAFAMHVDLQGTDDVSAIVSLEVMRRMIDITRDGSGYSHEEMTHDIQMLAGTAQKEMAEAGITFVQSPASRVQFELMLESGMISHFGAMQVTRAAKSNS